MSNFHNGTILFILILFFDFFKKVHLIVLLSTKVQRPPLERTMRISSTYTLNLHNDMILCTLDPNSHGFLFELFSTNLILMKILFTFINL